MDIHLQVGVKAILQNSEGKYLVLKRSEEKYKGVQGSWDIVGGRIDPGTDLMHNLRREIEEETRLSLIGEPKLLAAQDIMPVPERHIVRLTYLAMTEGEPVLDGKEHSDYRWVTGEELAGEQDLDRYLKELIAGGILE